MKTTLLFISLILGGCALPYGSAHAAEISKADILATVQHLRALNREALRETAAAKAESDRIQKVCDKLAADLKAAEAEARLMAERAKLAGKERDVVVIAFALICSLYFGSMFAGTVLREFPAPYGLIAAAGIYVAVFGAAFGAARLLLRACARFIP